LLLVLPGPLRAQGAQKVLFDGIAAVVDDEVILLSDVEEQARLYAQELGVNLSDTAKARQLRRDILERLIDERLLVIEAKKSGVEIDENELEQAVKNAMNEAKGRFSTHEEFLKQLEKEGISEAQLKHRYNLEIKRQLLASKLIGKTLRDKPIDEKELHRYYDEHIDEIPERPAEVWLQHILVKITPDTAASREALEKAMSLRRRVLGGESFSDLARVYSSDPSAKYGGSLGKISRGDLRDRALEDTLFALEPGEVSMPVRTPLGLHLLTVENKEDGVVEARQIVIPLSPTRADTLRALEKARRVRELIESGRDFGELAREFSDDEMTRSRGGDVGYVSVDGIAPQILERIRKLQPGQVSEVFQTGAGFHILKLNGRHEAGRYTFDEARGRIESLLKQRRIDDWIALLRKKIYVQMRVD